MSYLKITWKKSFIGRTQHQRRIIRSLGFHRLNQEVIHHDSPTIRGMVEKVIHLLHVEAVTKASAKDASNEKEALQ